MIKEAGQNSKMCKNVATLLDMIPCRDLVCRFFFVFSRFEYALKAEGYVCGDNDKAIKPDWDRFVKQLPDLRKSTNEDVAKSAAFLDEHPPQKQVIKGGRLGWKSHTSGAKNNVDLFVMVRRVRNNVFHGGKFPFDTTRDAKLLEASLTLLYATLAVDSPVSKAFFGPVS